jgi:dynein heavy chain
VQADMKDSIAKFMAYVHTSVNEISQVYLTNEKQYNYTTPKSFLEQVILYQNLLRRKNSELQGKIQRLENGLEKLRSTAGQVNEDSFF